MSERLTCQSCDLPKNELQRTKSKLFIDMNYNMCTSCIALNYEPRYIIVLAYRSPDDKRSNSAREYIQKDLYFNAETNPIPLKDAL